MNPEPEDPDKFPGVDKALEACLHPSDADFRHLSYEAQELIVDAALGKFDNAPPPDIPDSLRRELIDWKNAHP